MCFVKFGLVSYSSTILDKFRANLQMYFLKILLCPISLEPTFELRSRWVQIVYFFMCFCLFQPLFACILPKDL